MDKPHDSNPGPPPAEEPYERARDLIRQKPLNEDRARLIIALVEKALKEPGVTAEQIADLNKWREKAQAALPLKSFKDVWEAFQRWLLGLLPEDWKLRTPLLYFICIVALLLTLYEVAEKYRPKSETPATTTMTPPAQAATPATTQTTTSPSPPPAQTNDTPTPTPSATPHGGDGSTEPPRPSSQTTNMRPGPGQTLHEGDVPAHTDRPGAPADVPFVTLADVQTRTRERVVGLGSQGKPSCGADTCHRTVEVILEDTGGVSHRESWVAAYRREGRGWHVSSVRPR